MATTAFDEGRFAVPSSQKSPFTPALADCEISCPRTPRSPALRLVRNKNAAACIWFFCKQLLQKDAYSACTVAQWRRVSRDAARLFRKMSNAVLNNARNQGRLCNRTKRHEHCNQRRRGNHNRLHEQQENWERKMRKDQEI